MKTLGKTTWKKIKVGEVFAFDIKGPWCILYKISKDKAIQIEADLEHLRNFEGMESVPREFYWWGIDVRLYKLSESDQNKWRTP